MSFIQFSSIPLLNMHIKPLPVANFKHKFKRRNFRIMSSYDYELDHCAPLPKFWKFGPLISSEFQNIRSE